MPQITNLPVEVIASILRKLDNIRSFPASLLTCKHFFDSASENPGIAEDILKRQITPALLPYSVAVLEASRLTKPCFARSTKELLDLLYNEPTQLAARTKTMRLGDLVSLGCLHETIHILAMDFMCQSWSLLSQADIVLSSSEYFRVCRAFYRVELFLNLFRSRPEDSSMGNERSLYLNRHSPWENEQLGCVHDFLEKRLSNAIFDTVSQDIEFGEASVDYITCGGENYWKQQWGLLFFYRLTGESSNDSKKKMLKSALASPGAKLHDALNAEYNDDAIDDNTLEGYSDEELKALVPHTDEQDTDLGPYKAWYAAHSRLPPGAWVMFPDNSGRRERAYVLWDWRRLEAHSLLEEFENAPEPEYLQGDVEAMEHSFVERSKIWRQGGQGYWSKNNTSRIQWPEN